MSGPLAKGALVRYLPLQLREPVVTVFQYNPETMVHSWSQPDVSGQPGVESGNPLAAPGMPGESFEFTIFLNSDDDIVSPVPFRSQAAQDSGVGTRLAALEMLLYPEDSSGAAGGLVGTVSALASMFGVSGPTWKLPDSVVPIVLFYWNANRILPVRVTTLTITETLYDTDLNATHAQAQLSLRVLTPAELEAASPAPGSAADLAVAAYYKTLSTRQVWAAANTATELATIASNLPH